jgi:hypothetical protein
LNYIPDDGVYNAIINSNEAKAIIWRYGGNENLSKMVLHLDGEIFESGEKLLLPKNYKVKDTPINLIIIPRAIQTKLYRRYSVIYKEGVLKNKWEDLKSEIEDSLKISSLENASLNELREHLSAHIPPPTEERTVENRLHKNLENISDLGIDEEQFKSDQKEVKIPEEYYFSFLLLKEDWDEKLLPVVLHLSPAENKIEDLMEIERERYTETEESEEEGGEK